MAAKPPMSNGESYEMPHGESPWYDAEIDPDSDTTPGKVVRLVGTNKRVLELGCATGYMSRVLRDRGCQVVAVEMNPKMAERAAEFCERIIVGDIEQIDLARELGEDSFDVILAADFLEHLKDPLSILLAAKKYLRSDGYVVASLPNIAHGSVRLALLSGQFPYSALGLLDRTHLRFYTRETMLKLFEDAGFAVGLLDRLEVMIPVSEVPYDSAAVPEGLLERLSRDPDALTYQFIVVAYPMPRPELREVQRRIRELAEEKEAAQREVAQLRQSIEALTEQVDMLTSGLEDVSRQKDTLRAKLLDAHDQLLRRDDEIQFLRTREVQLEVLEREVAIKDRHIADLQAALDRILYSPMGRLYRRLRSIVTLGKR